ncbi:terpene synthase [Panus rudis PR-1116 ss-1]|nr:terpene synthase [Panus rudis PR-1116 ss-1]
MATPQTFILPDLVSNCPYPLRVNPLSEIVTRQSEEWILSEATYTERKRQVFLNVRAGVLTANCYPKADEFHLQVASDYLTWLFCFDDWSDEFDESDAYSFAECIMACLRDPVNFQTDKAAGRLTKSFFSRYLRTSGPRCAKRFIDTMDLYLKAVAQQAADRTDDNTPDLESYIALRRDTSACRPCFALHEWVADIDLPDEVAQHPLVKSMEEATNDLVSWSNDVFSYNNEQSRGDTHNLVAVIMKHRNLDLQRAMDYAGELCHQSIARFEAARHSLPSWGDEVDRDVKTYVQGMQDWIVGSLHWSFTGTRRYFGTEGAEIKRHRTVQLLPQKKPKGGVVSNKSVVVEQDRYKASSFVLYLSRVLALTQPCTDCQSLALVYYPIIHHILRLYR